jgi:hypothetical protein
MKLNAFAVVAVLVVGAFATGCGSSDERRRPRHLGADFSEGQSICKQGNDAIKQLGNSVNEQQLEAFATDTISPGIQKQRDGVKALGAPAGEEAQVNAVITSAQADLDKLKADPTKIKDNSLFNDANQKAKAVGLTECAGGNG